MQHLTITNIALLFFGILIKFLTTIQAQKKKGQPFLIGFFFKDNIIEILLTLVGAFSSLMMADDLLKLLHVTADDGSPFYTIHAFVSGIMPMFFISKIIKLFKPTRPHE